MPETPESAIPKHPIGVASERTGLSPDVLRVWERRYHAVSPDRSEGRQRLYSDDDIERLRLLRLATLPGRAISAVVSLSTAELERMVDEDDRARARVEAKGSPDAGPGSELVNRALAHVRMYDTPGLQWLLTRTVADLGV
ncbi:MAG: MerR family transcriptional regulator, partial [Gemmatimonadota bacterium]|nr:MerR family transcriptional regulator [Gemmatimonadota bacterium]